MLLRWMKLQNILSFRETTLDLQNLNVLIGANGSGKTNLIDCVGLLNAAPSNFARFIYQGGGANVWLWKGSASPADSAEIACRFFVGPDNFEYSLKFRTIQDRPLIEDERCSWGLGFKNSRLLFERKADGSILLGKGVVNEHNESRLLNLIGSDESYWASSKNPLDSTPLNQLGQLLGQIRIFKQFQTGATSPLRVGISSAAPNDYLEPDGSNLVPVIAKLEFENLLEPIYSYLRRLYSGFEELKVSPGQTALLYWKEENLNRIPALRMSEGTLKFLCLLTILLHPQAPPLVCLEEPEIGLHPDAVTILAEVLKEASQRMQLIVTTHSEALISALSDTPDSVVVCERDFDGGTQFRRLSSEKLKEWLEDYSLGELWRRGEIGANRW